MHKVEYPKTTKKGTYTFLDLLMAVRTRIELAISSVTGRHVNRYTTGPFELAKKEGFEPSRRLPDLCP